ncbi:hypothetical protein DPMN_153771 [Dreissena polymorpha]|uniref:Uncharacterized protein n=1 Tax=Dreissena polymorpha TaxID=45954 RepID=A0A9D4FMY7_DREPO|nr:hypothetical protein DPMN_153771 [Dreissena polymorpha]
MYLIFYIYALRFDGNAFDKKRAEARGPDIVYSPCRHIPAAPKDLGTWPEEIHLNYTFSGDLHDLPDPSRSKVELYGNGHVTIGSHVYVTITLFDRHGRKRRTGGDVVSFCFTH